MMKKYRRNNGSILLRLGDYVEQASESAIEFDWDDEFTISFWIANSAATDSILFGKQESNSVSGRGWHFYTDTIGRYGIRFYDGLGGLADFRTPQARFSGTASPWIHVVIRKIGAGLAVGNFSIRWNGGIAALTTVTNSFDTSQSIVTNEPLSFGKTVQISTYPRYYIRDFQVYNRVLTQFEIRRLYSPVRADGVIYQKGLKPDFHLFYDPNQYRLDGSPTQLKLKNEITQQYTVQGNISTDTVILPNFQNPYNVQYQWRGKGIRMKNLTNYVETEADDYFLYLKSLGGGVSYSRASSVQKMVGNGRVKFINNTIGTSVRHAYVGISAVSSIAISPQSASLEFSAGWGNNTYAMYQYGSLTSVGSPTSNLVCVITVDFDTDEIKAEFRRPGNGLLTTLTGTIPPSVLFPTQEWYVIPFTFYNNDDTNHRQLYHLAWDFNIQNPGTLQTNNIV